MIRQCKSSPEAYGIPSEALTAFFDKIEEEHLELHSFILCRNDVEILRCFRKPFGPDKLQRICSAGKALVALAVLFTVQEGLLSLNDNMYDLLPESHICPEAKNMTVRHLLTMHAGHREDSYMSMFSSENHMDGFFRLPFPDKPGSYFFYDNGIPDVLAEIVLRKTGMRISEYLESRLFAPLGIEEVRVEAMEYQDNLPTFCMKTEDLLKITVMLHRNGLFAGKRVLREDLANDACTWQVPAMTHNYHTKMVDTMGDHPGPGYGFQIWRNEFGGFCLNGGCGQLGLCIPDMDIVAAMHSDEPRSNRIIELLWKCLRGNVFTYPLAENPAEYQRLKDKTDSMSLCPRGHNNTLTFPDTKFVLDRPLCGFSSFGVKDEGEFILINFETEKGCYKLNLPSNGDWVCSHIGLLFPEQSDPKEHRKLIHGVRLDTNVGYDLNEGYACVRRSSPCGIEVWFRSDGWMGSNIIGLKYLEEGAMAFYENGISYNLRHTHPDLLSDKMRDCIYAEYVAAKQSCGGTTEQKKETAV